MGMDTTMPPHMMAMETTMLPDLKYASLPSATVAKADDLLTSSVSTSTTETNKLIETTNEGETSLPMTTIEPIVTTEPTTTPTMLNTMMEHTHEHEHEHHLHQHSADQEDHIQRINGHHAHEHGIENENTHEHAHDNGIVPEHKHHLLPSSATSTEKSNEIEPQTEEHINQISAEVDDDVKDFNNFRHPATLITASQSEESLNTGDKDNSKSLEEHEDPYHAHILSENHDRLAEHEDYQMLSSTEESLDDGTISSSTTTTTTTTTPKPFEETHTDEIVVSNENEATAKPLMHNDTTEGRARAINMDDDDEGATLTTSTTAATPVEPVINIVEGNHNHVYQHNDEQPKELHHMNVHIENQNQDDHMMTSSTTEKPNDMPAGFVFNGEGRSVDSSISAENDDNLSPFNYHYNFVTTQRNHNENEEKNSAYKDLSDVSMDEDDEDRFQKTHEHLHEHNNSHGEHHNHFAINENTKEMMTTNTNTQQNDSMTHMTPAPDAASTTTTTPETLTEPQMKITEITAAGDTMHRECLADGKSYKVSFTINDSVCV